MVPIVAAAATILAALSDLADQDDDWEIRYRLGIGGRQRDRNHSPDPRQPLLPIRTVERVRPGPEEVPEQDREKRGLLKLMGAVASKPLYAVYVSGDFLVYWGEEDDDEAAADLLEPYTNDNEDAKVVRFDDLPMALRVSLLDPHSWGSEDADPALSDAVLSGGASFTEIADFDMRRDRSFSDWPDEMQREHREHVLSEAARCSVGSVLREGLVVWLSTSEPDPWEDAVGSEIPPDLFSEGIAVVTDPTWLGKIDLDADAREPDPPTHSVRLRILALPHSLSIYGIPAPGQEKDWGHLVPSAEQISEILETPASPLLEGFDPHRLLDVLGYVDSNKKSALVADLVEPGTASEEEDDGARFLLLRRSSAYRPGPSYRIVVEAVEELSPAR